MDNGAQKQVIENLKRAERILIALPLNATGDALGSGLALARFLKKLEKEPEIVCQNVDQATYKFLSGIEMIKKELEASQSFVISVDVSKTSLDELSYDTKDKRLNIFLKPKSGKYTEDDISFSNARFPFDLIVTVDTASLEHLGKIYEENTDLFFETTVINIDHHPNNEQYGEINLVDLTATSSSEIVATLIDDFESSLIDAEIATNLLTGIIVETNSFQHVKTTPRAFLKASQLVAVGANQQEIVKHLYKSKNIAMLKLWGRALARLRQMPDLKLVYSLIGLSDIQKSGAETADVKGVIKEMIASLVDYRIIMLLAEVSEKHIVGYYHLHPSIKSQVVAAALSGEMLNGSLGRFEFREKTILEAETETITRLQRIKEQIGV